MNNVWRFYRDTPLREAAKKDSSIYLNYYYYISISSLHSITFFTPSLATKKTNEYVGPGSKLEKFLCAIGKLLHEKALSHIAIKGRGKGVCLLMKR